MRTKLVKRFRLDVDRESFLQKARKQINYPDRYGFSVCKAELITISGVDRLNLDYWTDKGYLKALPSQRQKRRDWPLHEAAVAVLLNTLRRFMQLNIAARIARSPEVLLAFKYALWHPNYRGLIPTDRNGVLLTPSEIAVHFARSGKISICKTVPNVTFEDYVEVLKKLPRPGGFLFWGRELSCAITIDLEIITVFVGSMLYAIMKGREARNEHKK